MSSSTDKTPSRDEQLRKLLEEAKEDQLEHEKAMENMVMRSAEKSKRMSAALEGLLAENLEDNVWAKKIFMECLGKANTSGDFSLLGNAVAQRSGLRDEEWGKELCQRALDNARDSDDFRFLVQSVGGKYGVGDKEWAQNLLKQALEKCSDDEDTIEDINVAISELDDE